MTLPSSSQGFFSLRACTDTFCSSSHVHILVIGHIVFAMSLIAQGLQGIHAARKMWS